MGRSKRTQTEVVDEIMLNLDIHPDVLDEYPDGFGGLDSRRQMIDGAQMKALPVWMQKMRRDIRKAWKERAERDDKA